MRPALTSLRIIPHAPQVAFVTFDSSLHFYNLKAGLSAPQMMVVAEVGPGGAEGNTEAAACGIPWLPLSRGGRALLWLSTLVLRSGSASAVHEHAGGRRLGGPAP